MKIADIFEGLVGHAESAAMSKASACLLVPTAYAGAFTAFPFFDDVFAPKNWIDVVIIAALLAPAYVFLLGFVLWLVRWHADRRLLGLTKWGWLILNLFAYVIGGGIVAAVSMS